MSTRIIKINDKFSATFDDKGVCRNILRNGEVHAEIGNMSNWGTCAIRELEDLRNKAENLLIAIGMGWDLDGVTEEVRLLLPSLEGVRFRAWRE